MNGGVNKIMIEFICGIIFLVILGCIAVILLIHITEHLFDIREQIENNKNARKWLAMPPSKKGVLTIEEIDQVLEATENDGERNSR